MNTPHRFPSIARLVRGMGPGCLYLLLLAFILSGLLERSFALVLAVVTSVATTLFCLALAVAVRWALGRSWQIDLASVFLAMTAIAVCLAAFRWLQLGLQATAGRWLAGTDRFVNLWFWIVVMIVPAIPFVIRVGDSILALAAWWVWRPGVQRLLRRVRRAKSQS